MKIVSALLAAVIALAICAEAEVQVFENKDGDEIITAGDIQVTVHNPSAIRGSNTIQHTTSNHNKPIPQGDDDDDSGDDDDDDDDDSGDDDDDSGDDDDDSGDDDDDSGEKEDDDPFPGMNIVNPSACQEEVLCDVGDEKEPAGVFPLKRCQGDCDENADCEGELICYERDGLETVPGCKGSGSEDTDYCIAVVTTTTHAAQVRGSARHHVASKFVPQGHDDDDDDDDDSGHDDDDDDDSGDDDDDSGDDDDDSGGEDDEPFPGMNIVSPSACQEGVLCDVGDENKPAGAFPLQLCQGDCDENVDCEGDLICYERSGLETVPGCTGSGSEDTDYCIAVVTTNTSSYTTYEMTKGVRTSSHHHTAEHETGSYKAAKGGGGSDDDDDDDDDDGDDDDSGERDDENEEIVCEPASGCEFEPSRPYTCGAGNCPYDNLCEAGSAGYTESDCCQAPNPSACTNNVDPQVCGTQQCEYSNSCIAELAGYSSDQCTPRGIPNYTFTSQDQPVSQQENVRVYHTQGGTKKEINPYGVGKNRGS